MDRRLAFFVVNELFQITFDFDIHLSFWSLDASYVSALLLKDVTDVGFLLRRGREILRSV